VCTERVGEYPIGTEHSYRLSTIFGGGEARFEGAFEELIDVTAMTRERGSHNAVSLNTSWTRRADGDKKAVTHDVKINICISNRGRII